MQLLVDHVDVVAPDPHDILHELLDDLGEVRDVDFLIGISRILRRCLCLVVYSIVPTQNKMGHTTLSDWS